MNTQQRINGIMDWGWMGVGGSASARASLRALLGIISVCIVLSGCHNDQVAEGAARELSFWDRYAEVEGFELLSLDSIPLGGATAVTWLGDTLVVADGLNSWVRLYSDSGREILRLGGSGDGPGEMRTPEAVAVDSSGTLWVGDFRARLLKRSVGGTGLETIRTVPPTIRSLAVPRDDGRLVVTALTRSDSQHYAATIINAEGRTLGHIYPVTPPSEPNRFNLQAFVGASSGGRVLLMDRSSDSLGVWNGSGEDVDLVPIPHLLGYRPIEWPEEPIADTRGVVAFMRTQWRGHVLVALDDGRFLLSVIHTGEDRRIQILYNSVERLFEVYGDAPPLPFRAARADTLYWVGVDETTGRSYLRRFAPLAN